MNPQSGPGVAVDIEYQSAMAYCHSKRQRVIGYVSTQHGARPLNQVRADIDLYYQFYPRIRGIFFDELSNDENTKSYYRFLYTHVKAKSASARVVGNPGIPAATAWQVTPPVVADILVVFEGPYVRADNDPANLAQYKDWLPPTWVSTRPANIFAHLIYESPDSATTRAVCLASFQEKNAGWIYVTQDRRPNPWDLPPDATLIASPTLHRREPLAPS